MIYLPPHFEMKDRNKTLELIRDYPFATLVSFHEGESLINHLPILLKEEADGPVLRGHMAKGNPHASALKDGDPVTVIFHGPHTYITPKWYPGNGVPTWNYAVVHVQGKIQWMAEFKPIIALLREMTDFFEGESQDRWRFTLPDDLKNPENLTGAIIGFEIKIETVESKFKLSQNRSAEDREGVLKGLETRTDEMSLRVHRLMND